MTKEKDIVVGIDVGTSKICTMVGKITSKDVEIIGMGLVPSKGMRKGMVIDIEEIASCILDSVEKAEKDAKFEIESAVIGITGTILGHLIIEVQQ